MHSITGLQSFSFTSKILAIASRVFPSSVSIISHSSQYINRNRNYSVHLKKMQDAFVGGCKKTVSEEHLTRRAALSGVLSRERGAKERTKEGKRKVLEQKE